MKNFIAKRLNSVLIDWRHLRFTELKYEKKKNHTFDHNTFIYLYLFKDSQEGIIRKVIFY